MDDYVWSMFDDVFSIIKTKSLLDDDVWSMIYVVFYHNDKINDER